MKILPLKNRKIIEISGKDRLEFLQGLITVDIYTLRQNHALWSGLLSPQGKALFDFFIYTFNDKQESVFIDIYSEKCNDFIHYLQKYILRSDVKIVENNNFCMTAIWGNASMVDDMAYIFADSRAESLGFRHIASLENHQNFIETYKDYLADDDDYKALRISLNIVDPAQDMPYMEYYWAEINAETMNGVDYKKGCYVGQEVTARMKHKTELKRQVIPVYVMGNPQTPAIMATDIKEIGTLLCVDSWTGKGLAYVYLNRWEHAIETLRSVTVGMSMITKAS
jgi:folate-binding protein YgfZ